MLNRRGVLLATVSAGFLAALLLTVTREICEGRVMSAAQDAARRIALYDSPGYRLVVVTAPRTRSKRGC